MIAKNLLIAFLLIAIIVLGSYIAHIKTKTPNVILNSATTTETKEEKKEESGEIILKNNVTTTKAISKQDVYQTPTATVDLSDIFKILPQKEYSIESNLLGSNIYTVPYYPQRFSLRVPYTIITQKYKPLWSYDTCNDDGVLEQKTLIGWKEINYINCEERKIGQFFNPGNGELYYVLTLEEGVMGRDFHKVDRTGDYRIRMDLVFGCQATKDNEEYINCNKGVAYSSMFRITK